MGEGFTLRVGLQVVVQLAATQHEATQPGGIEVEAHDPSAAFEGAVAVTPLAAARVEEALTGAKLKPLEIDREQH